MFALVEPLTPLLTLTGGVSTMRRIAISADTALRCTTCSPIHVVCIHAVLQVSGGSYGRLSCRSTVHLFAPLKIFDNRVRKYKQCSFSCGMEKYSTCRRTSAVFSNTALK